MRGISILFVVIMIGWATPIQGAPTDAPWSTTIVDSTANGIVRYDIWLDEGAMFRGRQLSWNDTQRAARNICINCDPNSWEQLAPGEKNRYFWALTLKDQQYHPLETVSFLIVNIGVERSDPKQRGDVWRADDRDLVYLKLADGRELFSARRVELSDYKATVSNPSSSREKTCWQMKTMLNWRRLYTAAELQQRWELPEFFDHPKENNFLVPVVHGRSGFDFHEIVAVTVYFRGTWVSLAPRVSAGQSADVSPTAVNSR